MRKLDLAAVLVPLSMPYNLQTAVPAMFLLFSTSPLTIELHNRWRHIMNETSANTNAPPPVAAPTSIAQPTAEGCDRAVVRL
jgi:hypothetical protein